jgi:hypothetical protein
MNINQKGFSHHLLIPLLAIVAVGAIGAAVAKMSSAAVTYVDPVTTATCASGYTLVTESGVSKCKKVTQDCKTVTSDLPDLTTMKKTTQKCSNIVVYDTPKHTLACPAGSRQVNVAIDGKAKMRCAKDKTYISMPSLTSGTAANNEVCSRYLLHEGMKNKCVKLVQLKLRACGSSNGGLVANGAYGAATTRAVKSCQRYLKSSKNSKIDVSGKVDGRTWTQLKRYSPSTVN